MQGIAEEKFLLIELYYTASLLILQSFLLSLGI